MTLILFENVTSEKATYGVPLYTNKDSFEAVEVENPALPTGAQVAANDPADNPRMNKFTQKIERKTEAPRAPPLSHGLDLFNPIVRSFRFSPNPDYYLIVNTLRVAPSQVRTSTW